MRVFPPALYCPPADRAEWVCYSSQLPDADKRMHHPDSYARVEKVHFLEPGLRLGTDEFLERSASHLQELLKSGAIRKEAPAYGLYRQTLPDGTCFDGWLLGISILDYEENRIRKHENTLRETETRLARNIGYLGAVSEPVLLAARLQPELKDLKAVLMASPSRLDFSDTLGRRHQFWQTQNPALARVLEKELRDLGAVYIADGHHRSAATCRHIRDAGLDPLKHGILALLMDQNDLKIKSFHRLITLDAPSEDLEKVCQAKGWKLEPSGELLGQPPQGEVWAMSREGFFRLIVPSVRQENPAEALDVARLEKEIFPGFFGIENSREDARISFLRGDTPIADLHKLLEDGSTAWIFQVAPNRMDEVNQVADAGLVMPPKSTWIEPKLLNGMLVMRVQP